MYNILQDLTKGIEDESMVAKIHEEINFNMAEVYT